MAAMDCPVCCESVSANKRKSCVYCDFTCCDSCLRRFTLDSTRDAHCMNCNKEFSSAHLSTLFPKTWLLKEYKKHRQNVLLEREISLLPSTQPALQAEKTRRENIKLLTNLRHEQQRLYQLLRENRRQIAAVENAIHNGSAAASLSEKPVFTIKCPSETCRGFLNSKFTCGTCDTTFCKDCHEPLTENHMCIDEVKATIQLLAKDTKSCPSCSTLIHKIEGCDQMFCTQCNTAFSWRTGHIVTSHIHNPHYYQWIRQGGGNLRQPGDAVCGGLPHFYNVQSKLNTLRSTKLISSHQDNTVGKYHRLLSHLHHVELRRYRVDINQDNSDLRIQYLLQELDADNFKVKLQKREKQHTVNREIYQILSTVDEFGTLEYINFMNKSQAGELIQNVSELINYANVELAKVSKRFNIKTPNISSWGDTTARRYRY